MTTADDSRAVRPGDEIDGSALARFLSESLGRRFSELEIRQFYGGHSNLTYSVRAEGLDAVLRRPPRGAKIATAHDMSREYRLLVALEHSAVPVPAPLAYCEDETLLGAPFYVMERVDGVILRNADHRDFDYDPESMGALSRNALATLVAIHRVDLEATGLADLGRPEGYVARQISGWTRRYENAQTDPVETMTDIATWLGNNAPAESGAALIHNDFKYDNLVLVPGTSDVAAVLDWEMATVGDPCMDLGTTLGYWVEEGDGEAIKKLPFPPTNLPGNASRQELVELYREATGKSVDSMVFYYVFGLFKIAVIAQQIYKRYRDGNSTDPRFAGMLFAVRTLAATAQKAIEKNRISGL